MIHIIISNGLIILIPFLIANLAPIELPIICPTAIVTPTSQFITPIIQKNINPPKFDEKFNNFV